MPRTVLLLAWALSSALLGCGPSSRPRAPDSSPLAGVQKVNVPVGGGSIFELRLREPGDYPFVTHTFADATKGAVGVLRALAARPGPQRPARPEARPTVR